MKNIISGLSAKVQEQLLLLEEEHRDQFLEEFWDSELQPDVNEYALACSGQVERALERVHTRTGRDVRAWTERFFERK